MLGEIITLSYTDAINFLLPKHYSGRKPNIKYAFGWIISDELVAVCTFGKPASPPLCIGVCGKENSKYVYELNRLCRIETFNGQLSQFVGACLRQLQKENLIIMSYSDTDMNHHGYIYQACNFTYTGVTKQRTDKYTEGNKHCRHYDNDNQNGLRKIRTAKHRYIFFCTKNKKLKTEWKNSLNYPILPYPKGDNSNYILGDYQKPQIIDTVSN
jgi:hypothetical protein